MYNKKVSLVLWPLFRLQKSNMILFYLNWYRIEKKIRENIEKLDKTNTTIYEG